MREQPRAPDREQTFRDLYEAAYPDLRRFVQRRVHPDHVDDTLAEVFLVVWRRLDEVPAARDDARAWVFGVARRVLLNTYRGDRRRLALGVRLADATPVGHEPAPDDVVHRIDLATAWRRLTPAHQETLALAVLDGLDAPRAAAVLGISPVAFRLRLSRARRALRLHLDHLPERGTVPARAAERTPSR
ncbi:RNA polymerase, sigma-24 subunit, ECF subfamily [Cellulomonas flavigena DSM 20109]|uniref:RNA polymerase, sigma-24 subunit, ECF subfamily n=1 Tax=Cellulomonas flavigena (strain ATCC 482 / DSM 20109 / BCRC 11376 / JCM 18109 / NBRC 3775 / NCIMB 8073 / NRS 134) TaxID=446466 RepID=D5UIR5_CELFN|nr:sigma-70 family RNA polymerase sigma factor [Cellulomonas flavigena]ADG73564.1 RNA polymerase, sigma-24 subunit, ECF subfamily [Cellulomonas flavigena DSM 20109]